MVKRITKTVYSTKVEVIPETLEAFKHWEFTSGPETGEDFKVFGRLYRSYIKRNLPEGATLVNFSVNHYYLSGFIERNKKYVYFSISDVRHFPNGWNKEILIRTAENVKDFTGGSNGWTTLENFKESVRRMLL